MKFNLPVFAAALTLSVLAHADCISGDRLFHVSEQVPNPVTYDAIARDEVIYSRGMTEIKLSAKPLVSSGHVVYLYSGFWLAPVDWCYDSDANVIRLRAPLRHGVSKKEVEDGKPVYVGYASADDAKGPCVLGNVMSALPGKPWNSNGEWQRDGKTYVEISEGYYEYDETLESFALRGKPAPGTQLEVSATVGGFPVGTHKTDWCYDAAQNAIHFRNRPLRKQGYAGIPANALQPKERFFIRFNELRTVAEEVPVGADGFWTASLAKTLFAGIPGDAKLLQGKAEWFSESGTRGGAFPPPPGQPAISYGVGVAELYLSNTPRELAEPGDRKIRLKRGEVTCGNGVCTMKGSGAKLDGAVAKFVSAALNPAGDAGVTGKMTCFELSGEAPSSAPSYRCHLRKQ